MQQAGTIRYSRGRIDITNADSLREASCECYEAVEAHIRRLLQMSH
jgi:hypothetical protein